MPGPWHFWIDRGGTFTDCLGLDPNDGQLRVAKVLSSDDAPLVAIRELLGLADDAPIPACQVRMGTTLATNALLERRGVATGLVITQGFADLLRIGDQTRPDLFALDIQRPALLHQACIETAARRDAQGHILAEPDLTALRPALQAMRDAGVRSLAIAVMHDHLDGSLERAIAQVAREVGLSEVSMSHEVVAELGLLGRTETTVVDAYLTPLLTDYLRGLQRRLPGSHLRIMQSSGGLTDVARFRGRDAVLSGPAGGVVALAHIARQQQQSQVIGFDMGGTSTDVSRWAGHFERTYETRVSGVCLRTPMMDIHTIAAGGGSVCRYEGQRLRVGPESTGANPGPLCYGRQGASLLALTDVNLALGRILEDHFPFALDRAAVEAALEDMARDAHPGLPPDVAVPRLARGFFDVAVESMAEAIRRITVARGHDVRDHALVVFGGAGGQHACAVARRLGMRTLLFHPQAGVLSAFGMGVAEVSWHGERDLGHSTLEDASLAAARRALAALATEGTRVLRSEGADERALQVQKLVDLRYAGTHHALTLEVDGLDELLGAFHEAHSHAYGYARPAHAVELVVARCHVASAPGVVPATPTVAAAVADPVPVCHTRLFGEDAWLGQVPVYDRVGLAAGHRLTGPAVVVEPTGTVVIDAGFEAQMDAGGVLTVTDLSPATRSRGRTERDPVLLEVFNHLFMSIAEQMGGVLQRTALSTNIRERLDFSCAIFDPDGQLVANAPHIPVHLGAMAESVQGVLKAHPTLRPGDIFVTNDPAMGGSHLPDVTVVAPVHDASGVLRFVCASRGHHSDIGGLTPGSMPHDSRTLSQEGVVFRAVRAVRDDRLDRDALLSILRSGPHPARDPEQNLADLEAQVAACHAGAEQLASLDQRFGPEVVSAYMQHIQDNAAYWVARAIEAVPDGEHRFEDALDDGTPIVVTARIEGADLSLDFCGSGDQHPGNLNAPRAVVVAAVLYCLRCLVGRPIPLNSGCMRSVTLHIPEGSVLCPSPEAAVVAGNVETSQRIVDVVLGALGVSAASQGTMNNLSFGDDSFGYYETLAGGAGATPDSDGESAVHTHMTNTRITDPEVLERRFPVRLERFEVRRGSGGAGAQRGGDGAIRELRALVPLTATILSERRKRAPFGLSGGQPGVCGANFVNDEPVPGRALLKLNAGDRIRIETPGGGGYGTPP